MLIYVNIMKSFAQSLNRVSSIIRIPKEYNDWKHVSIIIIKYKLLEIFWGLFIVFQVVA